MRNLAIYKRYKESVQKATDHLVELIKAADESRMEMLEQAEILSALSRECCELSGHVAMSITRFDEAVSRNQEIQTALEPIIGGNQEWLDGLNLQRVTVNLLR